MNRNWSDIIAAVIYVAVLFVLVRPESQASEAVKAVGAALSAMVRNATDLPSSGGKRRESDF